MAEPLLTDGVVTLRAWRRGDVGEMVACLDGDEEVRRWLDQVPQPYSPSDALAFMNRTDETAFAVTDAETGRVLGGIGLRWNEDRDVAETGYWLRADARGGGVMTRALVLVSGLALELGAARVQLRADAENLASRHVAERAGFQEDGVLRSARWSPRLGRRQDWVMYSLLPGELREP